MTDGSRDIAERELALDLGVLRNLFPDSDSTVFSLLDRYAASAVGAVTDVREAVEAGDPELVRRSAHRVVSGAAMVGAMQLASIARHCELAACSDPEAAAAFARRLPPALEQLRAAVTALSNDPTTDPVAIGGDAS